jgi:hypothetical protein
MSSFFFCLNCVYNIQLVWDSALNCFSLWFFLRFFLSSFNYFSFIDCRFDYCEFIILLYLFLILLNVFIKKSSHVFNKTFKAFFWIRKFCKCFSFINSCFCNIFLITLWKNSRSVNKFVTRCKIRISRKALSKIVSMIELKKNYYKNYHKFKTY